MTSHRYVPQGGPAFIWSLEWSTDGTRLVLGCWNQSAYMYHFEPSLLPAEAPLVEVCSIERSDRVYAVAIDDKGEFLCVGGRDKLVAMYDTDRGDAKLNAHTATAVEPIEMWEVVSDDFVYCLALSEDMQYVASSTALLPQRFHSPLPQPLPQLRVPSPRLFHSLLPCPSMVLSHSSHPSPSLPRGRYVAFGGTAKKVSVLSALSGTLLFESSQVRSTALLSTALLSTALFPTALLSTADLPPFHAPLRVEPEWHRLVGGAAEHARGLEAHHRRRDVDYLHHQHRHADGRAAGTRTGERPPSPALAVARPL